MGFIFNLTVFVFTFFTLVVVHEFGHFWVARRLGVVVEQFSIGFGYALWSFTDKLGTKYRLSILPLGGYVKLYGEESDVSVLKDAKIPFTQQPLWIRTMVVLAGPIFNLLFAVIIYSVVFTIGFSAMKPVVGLVTPSSPAAFAGLRSGQVIRSVDGYRTDTWRDVRLRILTHYGESRSIDFSVSKPDNTQEILTVMPATWRMQKHLPILFDSLGFHPKRVPVPAILAQVTPGEAAAKAGLLPGDTITSIDSQSIQNWRGVRQILSEQPKVQYQVTVDRNGQQVVVVVKPPIVTDNGQSRAVFGIASVLPEIPDDWVTDIKYSAWQSVVPAAKKTLSLSQLTLILLKKILTGKISMQSISGPVGIAVGAGKSADFGLLPYLKFLALISISLGIINLLPIPVLDGGHLIFYLVEAVTRRQTSLWIREMAMRVGFVLLMGLLVLTVYFDVMRLYG